MIKKKNTLFMVYDRNLLYKIYEEKHIVNKEQNVHDLGQNPLSKINE